MVVVKNAVFALGFFDCIHNGHKYLLSEASRYASDKGLPLYVLTFGDEFISKLGRKGKEVYTFSERLSILLSLGFNNVVALDEEKDFLLMPPLDFLEFLDRFEPCAIFAGSDYRYGRKAVGDTELLSEYMIKRGVSVHILPLLTYGDKKIASSSVRQMLESGNIGAVNKLLSEPYFVSGTVEKGRGDGRKIGFPTANLTPSSFKQLPSDGVYCTKTIVDGCAYASVTNVGAHPTFGDDRKNIETLIIDFCGDLYGRQIKVSFLEKIRDIIKFSTKEQLAEQIARDTEYAKKVNR